MVSVDVSAGYRQNGLAIHSPVLCFVPYFISYVSSTITFTYIFFILHCKNLNSYYFIYLLSVNSQVIMLIQRHKYCTIQVYCRIKIVHSFVIFIIYCTYQFPSLIKHTYFFIVLLNFVSNI